MIPMKAMTDLNVIWLTLLMSSGLPVGLWADLQSLEDVQNERHVERNPPDQRD